MSRDQQTATYKQAKDQNSSYYDEAQNSYTKAQTGVADYEKQLADYAAKNPFREGGEFQTSSNRVTANTADALARSTGNLLQSNALRTGQNAAGAVAATEAMEQQNNRDLSAEQAQAEKERIGGEAGYNADVLKASAVPEAMEASLSHDQASAAQGTLNTQEDAARQPSWLDQFGQAFGESFGSGLGTLASGGKH